MARIVQVAPDVYPLPSLNYGGLEKIVYELTEELVRRGHEVYLYAPKGSKTKANLIPYTHDGEWKHDEIQKHVISTLPENIDIIHDHTHYSLIGRLNLEISTVSSIHIPVNNPVKYPVYVSKYTLNTLGGNNGNYVYNGINPDEYEFSQLKDDYLLFIGTLTPEKGIQHAIEVAEKSHSKLIIAGPCHLQSYFEKEIEPRIKSNSNIQYIGAVSAKLKQILLKYAKCVIFPSLWESFGLVMVEAMACGTPVLGLSNCSVPEVLGCFPELVCDTVDEMTQKVIEGNFPSPGALREYVINNFTTSIMVDGYIKLYRGINEYCHF